MPGDAPIRGFPIAPMRVTHRWAQDGNVGLLVYQQLHSWVLLLDQAAYPQYSRLVRREIGVSIFNPAFLFPVWACVYTCHCCMRRYMCVCACRYVVDTALTGKELARETGSVQRAHSRPSLIT